MKITLSYCRVSARDKVRSSFQAKASSRSSPARNGRCRSFSFEIGEGRLALDKLQMHQPARRIVDEYEQRALRAAVLEPPMLAAVDLHQFADTLAPIARLVDM